MQQMFFLRQFDEVFTVSLCDRRLVDVCADCNCGCGSNLFTDCLVVYLIMLFLMMCLVECNIYSQCSPTISGINPLQTVSDSYCSAFR